MSATTHALQKRPASIICLSLIILITILLFLSTSDVHTLPSQLCSPYSHGESNGGDQFLVGVGEKGGTKSERLQTFKSHFPPLRPATEHGYPNETESEVPPRLKPDHAFDWPSIKTMFAFGDSFTTNYYRIRETGLGNGRPETMWHLSVQDHRLTDRIWVDWLWGMFKDTRTTKYWNIARAGATVAWDILPPGKEEWGTYEDQLDDFTEFFTPQPGPKVADWQPESTLFLIFFGINDISQLDRKSEGEMPIRYTCYSFAHSLFEQTSKLYDQGARHFLFLNAHPFYRSPKYTLPHGLGHDIYDRVVDSVTWFNEAFELEIAKFRQKHRRANVMDFDLFRFIDLVLDEPEIFGLTDTERYEMIVDDSGEETEFGHLGFAFRDFQHLSWSTHLLIARALNGLLLRKSTAFTKSNATEEGLYVYPPPMTPEPEPQTSTHAGSSSR